jgi:hypothetical protein
MMSGILGSDEALKEGGKWWAGKRAAGKKVSSYYLLLTSLPTLLVTSSPLYCLPLRPILG